jgi:polyisoprenoid-binding protein YceI
METATITQSKWTLDTAHSEIGFKVKHMMITNVSGSFENFNLKVVTDGSDFSTAKIDFTTDVASITTGNNDRDNHLKSPDFFDAERFPQIRFSSGKIEQKDEETFILQGNLTIKETTKPVTLNLGLGGTGKDPWGNQKVGFTFSGKINRTDFGLKWNAALETGGVLVSEEVKLFGEIQLVKEGK